MEDIGREVVYPTVDQICEVNRRMIESFGGRFVGPNNLLNIDALEYILAAVASPIFGYEPYPTLKEKGAALGYQIISRHVFEDGNKRTGIHIAWEFLRSNGVVIDLDLSVVDLAVSIAADDAGYGDLLRWLHDHQ